MDKDLEEIWTRKRLELARQVDKINLTMEYINLYTDEKNMKQLGITYEALEKLLDFDWEEYKLYFGVAGVLYSSEATRKTN